MAAIAASPAAEPLLQASRSSAVAGAANSSDQIKTTETNHPKRFMALPPSARGFLDQ